MKRFILLTTCMCGITVCLLVIAFMAIPAGRIGDIYPRVITPRQHSLVIGTSRAAQSVNPLILNECLEELYTPDLYNFAFHLDISSYNPYYVEAIRKKLLPYDGQKHYFILAVDPWSFDDGVVSPPELSLRSVSSRPNLEFIVKNFTRIWFTPFPTYSYVNRYGRTEVYYEPGNEEEWRQRVKARLAVYEGRAAQFVYSTSREHVCRQLITELSKRGDVYLVRIPVSKPMLDLENKVCKDFSKRMQQLAHEKGVWFFDFSHEDYRTTDGNHLTLKEGDRFSRALADSIRKTRIKCPFSNLKSEN